MGVITTLIKTVLLVLAFIRRSNYTDECKFSTYIVSFKKWVSKNKKTEIHHSVWMYSSKNLQWDGVWEVGGRGGGGGLGLVIEERKK